MTWASIPGASDVVVGVIDVSVGTHNIYHTDPTVVFSAISTGVANYNSYAFATGTRLARINSVRPTVCRLACLAVTCGCCQLF